MPVPRLPDTAEAIDPELVASGRLNLIGVGAVRDALGERWPKRREQVWAHIDRAVGRALEPGDVYRRVSEVDYLLAFASIPPQAARIRCLQILSEVLTHFLGESDLEQMSVSVVSSLADGLIKAEPVALAEAQAMLTEPSPAPRPAEPEVAAAPASSDPWKLKAVRLSSGLELQISGWVEPLRHVRRDDAVGLRFARAVVSATGQPLSGAERERLEPSEWADLDLASLEQVRVGVAEWGDRAGVFMVPCSYGAFAHAAGRARLASALSDMNPALRSRVILEVDGLPDEAPPSRIAETLGYMRPFGRGVVLQASPSRACLERVRGAGVLGVALNAEGMDGGAGEVFGCLKLLADRSRGIAPEVFALGLPTPELATLVTAVCGGFYSVRPELGGERQASAA